MKLLKIVVFCLFLSFPIIVSANNEEFNDDYDYNLLSSNTKYYKTITIIDNSNINLASNILNDNIIMSYTEEITEKEYENVNEEDEIQIQSSSNTVQTEYKKLTVSILENGTKYMYTAVLDWKKMPAVRSYDIIAIGYYQSVKTTSLSYQTDYCLNNGSCYKNNVYNSKITASGSGATFKLPESKDLKSLKNTLKLYMDKNVNDATIIEQNAVADYAHAVKTVSSALAQEYSINLSGIALTSNNISSYDDMSNVSTKLSCSW